MARNRITPGGAARRALCLAAALGALALLLAGCGDGGGDPAAASEKEADVAVLNEVLSRQLAAADAYERTIPALRGRDEAVARQFRAQEQEHAVAIVKALRGLGAESEPEPEPVEAGALETRADRLGFLYELEGATIDFELSAITKLNETWPRALLGSIVANQAQHRLVLRQLLGAADPADPVPEAFENGTQPELEEAAPPSGEG